LIIYDNGYESTIQFILRYAKRWEKTIKWGGKTPIGRGVQKNRIIKKTEKIDGKLTEKTPIGIVDYNTNL
jgi:Mg-chelatase subunit ChlD